jgi:hypothetical protein
MAAITAKLILQVTFPNIFSSCSHPRNLDVSLSPEEQVRRDAGSVNGNVTSCLVV